MKHLLAGVLVLGWVVMMQPNPRRCQDPVSSWEVIGLYRSMPDCLQAGTYHGSAVWEQQLDLTNEQAVRDTTDSVGCLGDTDHWQKKSCFELGDPRLREAEPQHSR